MVARGRISDNIHLFNEKLREWEDYYIYRLSDLLFVIVRVIEKENSSKPTFWKKDLTLLEPEQYDAIGNRPGWNQDRNSFTQR